MKINIVGCGLAGITSAVLLKEKGHNVKIFEKRNHIGGNCYDSKQLGINVHVYGPHIFHTDDEEVFQFLSKYTEWSELKYKPVGRTRIGDIPLPYSKKTVEVLGRELSQDEIVEYIFKDYSEKQWGVPFEEIPKKITNRIPKTKDCDDPTWFEGQKYQCIPKNGYTKMFENMLDGIPVILNDNNSWKEQECDLLIYTGKIDEYFDYVYGDLPYRSLRFEQTISDKRYDNLIYNECNPSKKWTRTYDHSFLTPGYDKKTTIITHEYPIKCERENIPFYPIPWGEGLEIYKKYEELAKLEKNVLFVGRLATYTYLDMWMAIRQVFNKLKPILTSENSVII